MNTDKAKRPILFAIFVTGFTAMSAQIILLRQLIVIFYGNEISLGILLGAWLFWVAVGSWILSKLAARIRHPHFYFAALEVILAFVLVSAILIIRNARLILRISPGEIIGFLPMIVFAFLILAFICVILGFLFVLACRIYPEKQTNNAAVQIGRVYILEALGAVCGGCIVSFFLIRYLDAFYLLLGLAALNIIASYFLQSKIERPKFVLLGKGLNIVLIICLLFLLFSQKAKEIKQYTIEKQWQDFALLTAKDSIYSNLVLTKQDIQYSFFSNGLYLFTVPDAASSEEAVHFALLQTAYPERVLLVGGGMAGLAEEILKHPVSTLHYVELDPEVIELGKAYLPEEYLTFLKDERLSVFHQDGRLFIKQVKYSDNFKPYDSVIVYLGDPYTAQINRFYTSEFFQEVKKVLAGDGVFSFHLGSSENFLNQEQRQFLACIYKTLNGTFKEIKIIPGDTAYFLATDKEGILTYDYKELLRRLKKRNIKTKFVREYYLFAKLSKERIAYIEEKIKPQETTALNRDLRPISYYYDMVLWSTYFTGPWRKIFSRINTFNLWGFFSLSYFIVLLSAFILKRKKAAKSQTALLAVSTTGMTEMTFQVVILLAFQIIYGYLYYKLGVILSFFMVGLVLGGWLITRRLEKVKDEFNLFIKTQIAICIYPMILPFIFFALSKVVANNFISWVGSNIIFPGLPIISGFIGGFQFPLANKIILKNHSLLSRTAGLTYGMDLLGSCLGALLVSTFLVPILGITQTCMAVALLNLFVLFALVICRGKRPLPR